MSDRDERDEKLARAILNEYLKGFWGRIDEDADIEAAAVGLTAQEVADAAFLGESAMLQGEWLLSQEEDGKWHSEGGGQ